MTFRIKIASFAFMMFSMSLINPAWAGCPHQEMNQSQSYGVRAPGRLIHGVLNVLSSPIQLFTEPKHTVQCEKPDLLLGLGKGVIFAAEYLILGVWDVATFWVPGDSGQSLAVTKCGWAHASRDCQSSCKKDGLAEPTA